METGKKLIDTVEQGEKITRKQAIKKAGVTALAASSLLLLNTQAKASASGGGPKGNNGWGNGDQDPPGNSGPHNNAENGPKSGPRG